MLVITLGDPFSINQACLLRLAALWAQPEAGPVVLLGSLRQWQLQTARFNWPRFAWQEIQTWSEIRGTGLYFMPIDSDERAIDAAALSERERGQIASRALWALKDLPLQAGKLVVLTAPIDKKACAQAGFNFPGQTEYFEQLWGKAGIMILAGPRLKVALTTNHLALEQVSAAINGELVQRKIQLLHRALQEIFHIQEPRLGVAALNPHAGDGGLFGLEDQTIIAPAIERARQSGIKVSGPHPADTVFFHAYEGRFDGVLAMYHDQGLGPLKTVHFYEAVNITGGLPALRLSPDHGPAADLYGRDEAREDSFRLALQHARHYLGW